MAALPPLLVIFLIAPPALGAYYAERAQSTVVAAEPASEFNFAPLATDPPPLLLEEVVIRAAYDDGATLRGSRLELKGSVSRDRSGKWYVTKFGINCCAADATVTRVIASGVDGPPDDQWVKVVGTYVEGTGAGGQTLPEVRVEALELVNAPRNQYR